MQAENKSIWKKIRKWLYIAIDLFVSSIAILSFVKFKTDPTCGACGGLIMFVFTFPVALVLNLILIFRWRKRRKESQLSEYEKDSYDDFFENLEEENGY